MESKPTPQKCESKQASPTSQNNEGLPAALASMIRKSKRTKSCKKKSPANSPNALNNAPNSYSNIFSSNEKPFTQSKLTFTPVKSNTATGLNTAENIMGVINANQVEVNSVSATKDSVKIVIPEDGVIVAKLENIQDTINDIVKNDTDMGSENNDDNATESTGNEVQDWQFVDVEDLMNDPSSSDVNEENEEDVTVDDVNTTTKEECDHVEEIDKHIDTGMIEGRLKVETKEERLALEVNEGGTDMETSGADELMSVVKIEPDWDAVENSVGGQLDQFQQPCTSDATFTGVPIRTSK